MTEDEKYVREHWEDVYDSGYSVRFCIAEMAYEKFPYFAGVIHRWAAAAEFTRTRLQQIRDVEEEIAWLTDGLAVIEHMPIAQRILNRLNAALADLKRGLRVAEERTERK